MAMLNPTILTQLARTLRVGAVAPTRRPPQEQEAARRRAGRLELERVRYLQEALGAGGLGLDEVEAFRTRTGSYRVHREGARTRVVREAAQDGAQSVFESVHVGAQRLTARAPLVLLHAVPCFERVAWTTTPLIQITRRALRGRSSGEES